MQQRLLRQTREAASRNKNPDRQIFSGAEGSGTPRRLRSAGAFVHQAAYPTRCPALPGCVSDAFPASEAASRSSGRSCGTSWPHTLFAQKLHALRTRPIYGSRGEKTGEGRGRKEETGLFRRKSRAAYTDSPTDSPDTPCTPTSPPALRAFSSAASPSSLPRHLLRTRPFPRALLSFLRFSPRTPPFVPLAPAHVRPQGTRGLRLRTLKSPPEALFLQAQFRKCGVEQVRNTTKKAERRRSFRSCSLRLCAGLPV